MTEGLDGHLMTVLLQQCPTPHMGRADDDIRLDRSTLGLDATCIATTMAQSCDRTAFAHVHTESTASRRECW